MFKLKNLIPHYKYYNIFQKQFWKYWWQRKVKGFDDTELWSLDYSLTEFIAPRLQEFIRIGTNGAIPQIFLDAEYKKSLDKGFKWNRRWWRIDNKKENKKCWERARNAWIKVLKEMLAGFEDELLEEQDWNAWRKKWKPTVDKYNKLLSKAKNDKEKKAVWDKLGESQWSDIEKLYRREISYEDVVYPIRQKSRDLLAKYYSHLWY